MQRTFTAVDMELRSHMPKEEVGLVAGGDVTGPISVMIHEHADVGDEPARLRELTDAYAVPKGHATPTARCSTGTARDPRARDHPR